MRLTRRDFVKEATLISLAPTVPAFLAQTARAAAPSARRSDPRRDPTRRRQRRSQHRRPLRRRQLQAAASQAGDRKEPRPSAERRGGTQSCDARRADLFHDGRLAIVQGVGYPNPNKSHDVSRSIWETARFDPTEHNGIGWIGRALDEGRAPKAGGPSSVLVGPEALPVTLRGRKSIAATLSNLDDMMIGDKSKPATLGRVADGITAGLRAAKRSRRRCHGRPPATSRQATAGLCHFALRGTAEASGAHLAFDPERLRARVYYAVQTGYDTHVYQRETHERLLARTVGRAPLLPERAEAGEARRPRRGDDLQRIRPPGRRECLGGDRPRYGRSGAAGRTEGQGGTARNGSQPVEVERRRPGGHGRFSAGLPGHAGRLATAPGRAAALSGRFPSMDLFATS